jgi:hypothetical protein
MPPKKQMVPKSKIKVNALNLSKNFRFVERRHVFSRSWVKWWEKWIKHLQYNTELYTSRACVAFSSISVSMESYTHRYQRSSEY